MPPLIQPGPATGATFTAASCRSSARCDHRHAALLAIFLMVRGRIRVDHGFSGTKILRFASFERFTHWLTAAASLFLRCQA